MNDARFVIHRHWRPWGARFTFQLFADNNEALFASEPYATRQAARDGIKAIRRLAPHARVVDMSA